MRHNPRVQNRYIAFSLVGLAACSSAPIGTSAPPPAPASAAPATASAHVEAASPAIPASHEEWLDLLAKSPATKPGCFHASEPSTIWEEVPCGQAPIAPRRYSEKHVATASVSSAGRGAAARGTGPAPELINGSSDDNAFVSAPISAAKGFFPFESGGSNESDNNSAASQSGPNSFTLQLNTNTFQSSACNSQNNCQGWVQFIYEAMEQKAYFEFSLIGWAGSCPDPYNNSYTAGGQQVCYYNTETLPVPGVAPWNLPTIAMTGSTTTSATGAQSDTLTMTVGTETYKLNEPSKMDLETGWNAAEFNVYGDNNSTQATFNSPTALQVEVDLTLAGGSTAAPTCGGAVNGTAETNNLFLNGGCCAFGGSTTGIRFSESTVADAGSSFICPTAPNCQYTYDCGAGGEIVIYCTPDGNNPSDSILVYQVTDSGNVPVAGANYTTTVTGSTLIAGVSTVASNLTSQTLIGCTLTPWGGQVCDPTPFTIDTPSCVGQPCGNGKTYNSSGQCVGPCVPVTCSAIAKDCGTWADGCGGDVTCGTCPSDMVCQVGQCVGSGGPGGSFCTQCEDSGGVCSTYKGKSTCIHN